MSYKCSKCSDVCFHSELKHVTKIRDVGYDQHILKYNKEAKKKDFIYSTTYNGWEIVNEERFCESCYEIVKDTDPIVTKGKNVRFNTVIKELPKNEKQSKDKMSSDEFSKLDKFSKDN
jgi:hypothetical protein